MEQKSDHIIGLIGKSGSGKTAIADYFRAKGYNVIESYTDRPKRYAEEGGHIYISSEEVEQYKDDMIAYTFFDNHHYFATRNQYKNKGITFYTIDPAGVTALESRVKDAKLTFIYINVEESIRRERMLSRCVRGNLSEENCQRVEKEVSQRIEHDKKAFEVIKCNYIIDNNDQLIETVRKVEKLIKSII
jgi:guanylate kinase